MKNSGSWCVVKELPGINPEWKVPGYVHDPRLSAQYYDSPRLLGAHHEWEVPGYVHNQILPAQHSDSSGVDGSEVQLHQEEQNPGSTAFPFHEWFWELPSDMLFSSIVVNDGAAK
ncbi:hypothetical protein UCDDS831_g02815 [Diplodia seriata]|uniref:Uncharacterized protein n=1 Tax=Diplodia seriata TaxID=420778 RepID=A0A0G2EN76_9PEZI|nr:hypothetical protein UCDDS831_g02815 [Diplodia seriata]